MNSKKKLMLAITALTMSVTSAMAVSACGKKHRHSYSDDWTVVTAPTCTEAGLESHKCQGCDETETRPIDAIGHAYSDDGWTLTTEPTCIKKGEETRVCANDESHVEHRDVAVSTNHPYGEWTQTKEPTCIAEGEETRVCTNDESHVEHRSVGKIDHHTVTEWVNTDPTYHWKKCTTKDCTEISEKKKHEWDPALDEVLEEPGENTNGSKRRHCECGATKISSIPMLGHVEHTYEDEWQKNATNHYKECTFDGCEEVLESIHDWNITTPATCDTAGSKVCKVCDYETEIPALGHTWTANKVVKTPATCETAGEEGYKCTICGEFKDVTAIPALGHKYDGDWIIDNPDANTKGSAVKYCANDKDHDHDIDLELPELNNTDYVVDEGELETTYTLKKDETIVITVHKNLNVEKAIDIAVSNMGKVLSGEIIKTSKMAVAEPTDSKIEYEKGNNYIHIKDEGILTADYGGVEMFITKNADGTYFFPYKITTTSSGYVNMDDQNYMSVVNQVKSIYNSLTGASNEEIVAANFRAQEILGSLVTVMKDGNEVSSFSPEQLEVGVPFTLMYAEHPAFRAQVHYGIENLVKALYEVAKTNPNKDFTQNVSEPDEDGITTCSFSFGYLGGHEGYFAVFSVEFKLDKNFVMVDATVVNKGYTNKNGTTFTQQDGKYVVTSPANTLWVETYSVAQTRFEQGAKPVNPYTPEDMKVSRFDINQVEEKVIVETINYTISGIQTKGPVGDSLNCVAGEDGGMLLRLINIYPETANFFIDNIRFELYTADGKFIEELTDQYPDGNDGHVKASYGVTDNLLSLSFWVAGDYQLKIKTANVEKVINLHIPYQAPKGFGADIYQYNDVLGKWNNNSTTYNVYEGQALAFAALVDHPAYQTTGFTVQVTDAGGNTVQGYVSESQYVEGIEGKEVRLFRADEAGEYTVTLTTTHPGSSASASFTVTVNAAPDVASMLNGKFTDEDEEIAEVWFNDNQAIIKVGDDNQTIVSYTYNEVTHEFAVEWLYGPEGYNFGLEFSESFHLYLTYEHEVSGEKTKVQILPEGTVNDTLSGKYSTPKDGKPTTLTASTSGVYSITGLSGQKYNWTNHEYENVNGFGYLVYQKPDDEVYTQANGAQIILMKGESFDIYTSNKDFLYTYQITFVSRLTAVENITLKDAEVNEDQEITLTPVFTPPGASVTTGTWSSSNENIATVENGVVRGVSAGTVTIKFISDYVSDDGVRPEATCTVTVKAFTLTTGSNTVTISDDWSKNLFKFKGEANTIYKVSGNSDFSFLPAEAYDPETIILNSGNPLNITTDANGFAYFAISSSGSATSTTVNITKQVLPTGITVSSELKKGKELVVDETIDLTQYVTVSPSYATDKSYTVSTTNKNIVKVSGKTLTAVGAGTATITVTTVNGHSDEFTITVKADDSNSISVGEAKELEVVSGTNYILALKGGKANTTYKFTATVSPDGSKMDKLAPVNSSSGVVMTGNANAIGWIELTTDASGNVNVAVIAQHTGTIYLNVQESEVNEHEIKLGVDKHIALMKPSGTGTEYTLVGCKAGEKYVISAWYPDGTPRNDIKFSNSYMINPSVAGEAEFTYKAGEIIKIFSVSVNKTDIVIKLEKYPDAVNETITVGAEAKEISLGTNGGTLTLSGCEAGKTYQLVARTGESESSDISSVVKFAATETDNPLVFTYNVGTGKISITATERVTVYVTLEEVEYDTPILITEAGNYGSDTDADLNKAIVYQLDVGEGESYSVTGTTNADLLVGTQYELGQVVVDYTLDRTNLTEGTYYIALYAFKEDTTSAWFTVTKNEGTITPPGPGPDDYITYNPIGSGTSEYNLAGNMKKDFSFKGTAGTTYTITVAEGIDLYELRNDNEEEGTVIGSFSSSKEITADEHGYVHFRISDWGGGTGIVTITESTGGDEGNEPPADYRVYEEIELGTSNFTKDSGTYDYSFKGTAGVTYTISSSDTVFEMDNINNEPKTGNTGMSIQITADEYGYVHFRISSAFGGALEITVSEGKVLGENEIAVGEPKNLGSGDINITIKVIDAEIGASYTVTLSNDRADPSYIFLAESNKGGSTQNSNYAMGDGTQNSLTIYNLAVDKNGNLYVTILSEGLENATLLVVKN